MVPCYLADPLLTIKMKPFAFVSGFWYWEDLSIYAMHWSQSLHVGIIWDMVKYHVQFISVRRAVTTPRWDGPFRGYFNNSGRAAKYRAYSIGRYGTPGVPWKWIIVSSASLLIWLRTSANGNYMQKYGPINRNFGCLCQGNGEIQSWGLVL